MMTDAGSEVLRVEVDGPVALLTLDRPNAMNALSAALRDAIARAFRELEAAAQNRVAIVTGAGRAFCAGYDLKELSDGGTERTADSASSDMADAMEAYGGPIIAAVNGHAITGGFELALACDVIVASEAAKFADTHALVGILPGWGLSQKLPRLIGESRAKELAFTGNFLTADEALAWGLVNRVLPPGELLPACHVLASEMASCVPQALRGYKRLIDDGLRMPLGDALAMERKLAIEFASGVTGKDVAGRRKGVARRGRESG
jgi:enoyl-CoA hydratase